MLKIPDVGELKLRQVCLDDNRIHYMMRYFNLSEVDIRIIEDAGYNFVAYYEESPIILNLATKREDTSKVLKLVREYYGE